MNMKYLEIKDKKGFFRRGEETIEIDQITAEDLLNLINHAHEDEFEIDVYNEAELPNKAQQIIYENIYLKIADFLEDKEQFNEQANSLYTDAVGKYGADIDSEPEPVVDIADNTEVAELPDEEEINPEDIPF